jgi:plastocyanin
VVQSGPGLHIIAVEDNVFNPSHFDVNVGDTIRFVWTGVIPHTTTSDATGGADAWDSGLFGQGASYDLIIETEGDHPYYCIPHGGPGGIGMSGVIRASKTCNNGQGLINAAFTAENGSPLGYRVFIDGVLVAGPLAYTNTTGVNNTLIELEGDGADHILTIQDVEVDFCAYSTAFTAPDCPEICLIESFTVATQADVVHTINVEDFVFEPSYLQARVGETIRFVWTGEIPHTTTSDATSGNNAWASELLGQGSTYEITLTEAGLHPYYCVPHGGPGGIGMAGIIEALPVCEDSLATYVLSFGVTNGSSLGYRVFVGGQLLNSTPFPYDDPTGQNERIIQLPSFGQQLVITLQDMETPFCAATASITALDCSPNCRLEADITSDWDCTDDLAIANLQIIAEATGNNGFQIYLDGVLLPGGPFDYSGDTTNLLVSIPNDGFGHTITVADNEEPGCEYTFTVSPDCEGSCSMNINEIIIGTNRRHEVLVRDFDFFPLQVDATVGDTIHFIWTGEIPHTATSDATSGPDVWDSGLLGNGAMYEVVIQTAGEHPYYCIPHGQPGGIGMAGTIVAVDDCDDDELNVQVSFNVNYPEGTGYLIAVDGQETASANYNTTSSLQSFTLPLIADGSNYLIRITDNENPACSIDTLLQMPDCDDACFGIVADFAYQLVPTPFTYQFTDLSSNEADSWNWNFGDDTGSSDSNPLHTFPGSGDFEVCLSIEDSELGCVDTLCQIISIGDNVCEPGFSYEIDGLTVSFTDQSISSSTINNWVWELHNGIQLSGQANPSYSFPELANYEVCLTITTEECEATYCENIDLSDPCLVFDAYFEVSGENGTAITYEDQTTGNVTNWLWGFGDGNVSTEQHPTHTYDADGVYHVCLLVQDTINNCNDVYCIDQEVGTVGTMQPATRQELKIFPNPASTSVREWVLEGWQQEDMWQALKIVLRNINGQIVEVQQDEVKEQVVLSVAQGLPAGVYLLEARSEEGVYIGRVVVQ